MSKTAEDITQKRTIEWNKPSDNRLPNHGRQVRVIYDYGFVGINNYTDGEWVFYKNRKVIMWHELLEIPE